MAPNADPSSCGVGVDNRDVMASCLSPISIFEWTAFLTDSFSQLFKMIGTYRTHNASRPEFAQFLKEVVAAETENELDYLIAEIPRTLSGKKQELPIKKLMLGQPLEKVVNKDAMANPGCLDWYLALAQRHNGAQA